MEKVVIVKWKLKASEAPRIIALLPELAEKTRAEQGNISYSIYQSDLEPCVLLLNEEYANAEAAEAHRQSEHYQRIVVNEIIPHLEGREVIPATRLL